MSKSGQGWTLNALGNCYALSGQARRAVRAFSASIEPALAPQTMDLFMSVGNLAIQQMVLGELAAAEENLRRPIELAEKIGDEFYQASSRWELGRLLGYEGAFDEGGDELHAALASLTKLGHVVGQGIVCAYRALRALLMGEAGDALSAARRARELAEEYERRRYPLEADFIRAEWLMGWALVALASENNTRRSERLAEAETHLAEALTRCRRINLVAFEPDILLAWARWHYAKGDTGQARQHAKETLAIADRCEYRLVQAEIHNFLARLALDEGERKVAREHAEIAKERAWCDGPPHCYKPALDEAERLLEEAGSGA